MIKTDTTSTTVIIPACNEEAAIEGVLNDVLAVTEPSGLNVLVVDDGSTDRTHEILERFRDRITVVRHSSNRGYGAALKTGILASRSESVIFFDGDGQHDVTQLSVFAESLHDYEFVIGDRVSGQGIPNVRKPGKLVLGLVCNFIVGERIKDINCGLRGGRRKLYMRMLELLPDGFSFSTTSLIYILRSGFSRKHVTVSCHERIGTSSVRMVRDGVKTILLAFRLMMLFDPFRAFCYPAFALLGVGMLYQVYIFIATGWHIEGGALLTILAGTILFYFGLLADQISSLRKELSAQNSGFIEELRERSFVSES